MAILSTKNTNSWRYLLKLAENVSAVRCFEPQCKNISWFKNRTLQIKSTNLSKYHDLVINKSVIQLLFTLHL